MPFLEYFSKKVLKIKLVDKDDSWFMKAINFFLIIGNWLNITNIKDDPETEWDESFMGGYGTTIGHTIYDNPGWTWDRGASPHVVHELTHAVQYSLWMAITYIFNKRKRMYWESECVQSEVLCFPDYPRGEPWIQRRVQQFQKYGVPPSVARAEIVKRLDEIRENKPTKSARIVWEAYEAWKNEREG